MPHTSLTFRWLHTPEHVDRPLQAALAACWREVANAGGAVGFPFPPVDPEQAAEATANMVNALHPDTDRILIAESDSTLAGWLVLHRNQSPLTAHWARISRVQTSLAHRNTGIGQALMAEAARTARDDLGLEQLHLELRSGQHLEGFYRSCGWTETGRWPAALHFGPHNDRDEVLMALQLPTRPIDQPT